jgi:pimeloyl-ACP methyl ester carboxylesterase
MKSAIGLNVVVLPAALEPVREDAATYLAGGPGDAATELAARRSQQLTVLNMHRGILLVDQRGTGRSGTTTGTRSPFSKIRPSQQAETGLRQRRFYVCQVAGGGPMFEEAVEAAAR